MNFSNFDVYADGSIIKDIEYDENISSIKLKQVQKDSFKRDIFILKKLGICFNCSSMGLGKSILASMMALIFNKRVVVITPKDNSYVWRKLSRSNREFAIDYIVTKEELCGTLKNIPSQDKGKLLNGIIKKTAKGKDYIDYEINDNSKFLLGQGYFFIIDEAHMGKNKTSTNRAISCLTTASVKNYKSEQDSMIFITSATPTDKGDLEPIYNMLGLLEGSCLVTNGKSKVRNYEGIRKVITFCSKLNRVETINCVGSKLFYCIDTSTKSNEIKEASLKLFSEIIVPYMFSKIPNLESSGFEPIIVNSFHKLNTENGLDKILEEMKQLYIEVKQNKINPLSMFGNSLENLENALLPVFVGLAIDYLDQDPNYKMLIALNRIEHIKIVKEKLSYKYTNVELIYSKTKNRDHIIELFQEENDKCRVIICTGTSIKQGVSLDDRSVGGKFKRKVLVSPSCNLIDMNQITGRFFRIFTTTSRAEIDYIYGLPNNVEGINKENIMKDSNYDSIHFKVIKNLSKKSPTLKIFIDEGNLLPDELPFIFNEKPIYPRV